MPAVPPSMINSLRRRLDDLGRHLRVLAAHAALKRAAAVLDRSVLVLEYPPNAANVPRYATALPALETAIGESAARYRAALGVIGGYIPDLERIAIEAHGDVEPSWSNEFLPWLDAAALYAFLRDRDPARYVEIGSGNSTRFAARARKDGGLKTHFTSIDPAPRAEIDTLCDTVIRCPLEGADLSVFAELSAGDVVFLDGSHRVFMNNDVVTFFLEVLPALAPGVLVGIHDIYLPFDYPSEIAGRYYSEQYMLAAYLLGDPPVRIVLPSWYVFTEHRDEVRTIWQRSSHFREIECSGAAFWLQTGA